ncbi:D-isomer specific 2-hydroxyacid dehydrogenase [Schizopora paradoxa]|uniref:D-isomer specific 2-hydroxyacid dehydrogenase n=1 Tax=Schizopora paradoxa TaxID=27342 RepID=A0A0H2RES2_9AGAM|nr:D-isomer specific 2-hydroxyacid dehydrogenase [Schizopora paradoxa]
MSDKKFKVVICRDLGPDVMPILTSRKELDLTIWPHQTPCDRKWLLENIQGAAGVVVMLSDKVNDELLDAAGSSLKVVSTMSVGYEHVSLDALKNRNIKLGYTPDVLTDAVADIAVMLALMAGRNTKETMHIVDKGEWANHTWSPFSFCGPQLSTSSLPISPDFPRPSSATKVERTVGFLGFGRIAQATLARLVPFGVTKCIYSTNPSSTTKPSDRSVDDALAERIHLPKGSIYRVDQQMLAKESDVLFVLAPGGPATYHVIDEDFLKRMKKTAILINPSRGTLVDSDALAKALKEQWIWAAGLDVVEGEPNVAADHPLVQEPRCVILPHIGSATFETRLGMATLAAQNVVAGILGAQMPTELVLSDK